ncbi:hypothetical protein QIS99_00595 [Streptomyces sp. B-S-A8]|uniref:Integral membrane protein n=1 Tax=Streptomyces solicavernae TaxID=3043614 RepID=A0ABT6RJW3_9ACTN|nr:hypothetical protein [Streptomyces sp. B-S-A8]MDI3384725.1 hypothetical protein [Streptomyces sp. B-S-A8]
MRSSREVRERSGSAAGRVRAGLSVVLLVLACLLTPLGAMSTWAKYEIGDSDNYVATMAPLASDPDVQQNVADAISTEIMRHIDVGPLQSAVEPFLQDAVLSFAETGTFRTAWNAANRAAHDAVQDALNEGGDRAVTLDLAPIIEQARNQLVEEGVPFARNIPVEHTEITILENLGTLGKGFHMLQVAGIWLPIAAVLCAAAGIALAVRRRRAVVATALGLALSAGLLAVAVAVGRSLTLDDLPPDLSRPAVAAVYDALTESLRTASWIILALAVLVAVAGWVSGRLGWGRGRRTGRD